MIKDYLDREVYNLIIKNFNFNDINEIRLRINKPIIIAIKNKKYYLKNSNGEYVIATKNIIEGFVNRATENSLYAVNDSIVNGYLTLQNGVRIGLSGYVVQEGDKVVTIKNFQSINIRIPHFVKNCALPILEFVINPDINNTLIISPPGAGKTTLLRDLIYQLSEHNISKNVLIADERNEICSVVNGIPLLDLGGFCDIYTNCSKSFAFKNGIRSMKPDIIFTDEVDLDKDIVPIVDAVNSGVSVIATIHAKDIKQIQLKKDFDKILENNIFSRFIILSNDEGPGTIKAVYNEKLQPIYVRCV